MIYVWKATAVCPHCGERRELEGLDREKLPVNCQSCGQVMILKTPEYHETDGSKGDQGGASAPMYQYAPPPTPWYPYYNQAGWVQGSKRYKKNNAVMASILLYISGILGLIFWASFFLVGYVSGEMTIDASEAGSTTAFGFAMIMLASSFMSIVGGRAARNRQYETALIASIFGIVSFGYLLGSIFSIMALSVVSGHPEDFNSGGAIEGEPGVRNDRS